MDDDSSFQFVGIGAGPANLSLAALSQPVTTLRGRFFERNREPAWHPGLMFPESLLQTSFLKDLVTPVDPTNRYSFLAYLVAHKHFYPFLTAAFPQISRAEFSRYLAWVSRGLPNLELGEAVESVKLDRSHWAVRTTRHRVTARDLVLGVGRTPWVPASARPHLSDRVFHSSDYCRRPRDTRGKRVAVVGGGQSGAEVFSHLLLDPAELPARAVWVSRRPNFLPLDDSPFANEWFTPEYANFFYGLDDAHKERRVAEQTLASDGVTMALLADIYRQIYRLRYVDGRDAQLVGLRPEHELHEVQSSSSGVTLALRRGDGDVTVESFDLVILATGYRWALAPVLEHLRPRIHFVGDEPVTRADYSIEWDGPSDRRIFVQNAARRQRGVADPNLSLVAWRSAVILNALAGHAIYDVAPSRSIIEWAGAATQPEVPLHVVSRAAS